MFYFQARVEQSVLFHHLTSFSSYYDAKVKTSRTDSAAIHEPMSPAGYPKTHAPLVPQAQAGPTHHSPILGVQVPIQTGTPSPCS